MAKKTVVEQQAAQASSTGAVAKSAVKVERQALVRDLILETQKNIETGYIDLAKLLSEAYHKEFYTTWGFSTFEEYCVAELDVQYRKAMYFVEIWDKVKSLNLPQGKVAKLGWTKMKDIVAVISEENAKEWLEKAEKMSSRELTEAVKIVRLKDTKGTTVPVVTKMVLMMSEAEATIVLEAIEEAKKLCNSDNVVVALEMICQDWLADKGVQPERTTLERQIDYLERMYGVQLTVKAQKKKVSERESSGAKAAEVVEKASKKKGSSSIDDLLEEADGPEPKSTTRKAPDVNELLGLD